MFSRPIAANGPCASPPQLTVYLGKRDFVDHIDLVDPVGEFLEARKEGDWGSGAGQASSRHVASSTHWPIKDGSRGGTEAGEGQEPEGTSSTSTVGTQELFSKCSQSNYFMPGLC